MAENFRKPKPKRDIPSLLPGVLGFPHFARSTLLNPDGFLNNMGRDPEFTPGGASGPDWQRGTSTALGGTEALQWTSSDGRTVTAHLDPRSGMYFTSFGEQVTPPPEAAPVSAPQTPAEPAEPSADVEGVEPLDATLGGKGEDRLDDRLQGQQSSDTIAGGTKSPRGIRNNNPGNIEYGDFAKGAGSIGSDGRFAKFSTPERGIAAIYSLQGRYEGRGLTTVMQRISTWAPAKDSNNTAAYAKRVANEMGIDVNTPFSINDPNLGPKFVDAMITVENGRNPYAGEVVQKAQTAALGTPQPGLGSPTAPPPLARFVDNAQSGAPGAPPLPNLSPTSMAKLNAPVVEPVGGADMRGLVNEYAPEEAQAPGQEAIDDLVEPEVKGLAPAEPAPLQVKVRKGDTLWEIAKDHLGDPQRWKEIAAANNIKEGAERKLQLGTILEIPGAASPPTPPPRPDPGLPGYGAPPEVERPAYKEEDSQRGRYGAPEPYPYPPMSPDTGLTVTRGGRDITPSYGAPPSAQPAQPTGTLTLPPGLADEMQMENPPQRQSVVEANPTVQYPTPKPAVITDQGAPSQLATPEQMQQSFDTRQEGRLAAAQEQVPGAFDRMKEAFNYLMQDSIFVTGLTPTPGVSREPSPPELDLTTPIRNPDYGPQPTTKDQSRITPDMPSQQKPGAYSAPPAPPAPAPVEAPRDTTSGLQPAARSAADFKPFTPDAFQRGAPAGVANVSYGDVNGSPYVSYDQNGYHVVSTQAGGAARTPLTQTNGATTSGREYYNGTGWQSPGGAPSTPPTPTTRPTTQPTQSSGSSAYGGTTTTPKTTYSTEPTRLTSGTGFTSTGGQLASI